jgi:hypothetical protein
MAAAACASCVPANEPQVLPCTVVGSYKKPEDLAQIYREKSRTLVIAEESVLVCGCERVRELGGETQKRELGGATQQRDLGGATQQRDLGGATQQRDLGGATQQRDLGGATQQRDLGGATQQRDLGGATQQRELGGAKQELTCVDDSVCGGYRIRGGGRIFLYDARGMRELPDRCVAH